MAWTTPRTWIPYELVTDSMLNVHVRDNLNAVSRPVAQFIGSVGNATGWTALWTYQPSVGEQLTLDGDTYILDAFGYFANVSPGQLKNVLVRLAGTGVVSAEGDYNGVEFHFHVEIRRSSPSVAISSATLVIGTATTIQRYGTAVTWSAIPALDIYGIGPVANCLYLQSVLVELRRKP